MCGRFSQSKSKQDIKKRFNVKKVHEEVSPLFNIAPDSYVPVILNETCQEVSMARWGLLPAWAKEEKTKYSMINARAENLLERTYKRLIQNRRCLVIADSFYEWKKVSDKKHPHRIMLQNEDLFAFAGLWDLWEKDGKRIISCSIITTQPNKVCADIHDRMPVILPKENEADWLSEMSVENAIKLLKPYPDSAMKSYEISTSVNNPRNNSAEIHNQLVLP